MYIHFLLKYDDCEILLLITRGLCDSKGTNCIKLQSHYKPN